MRQEDKKQSGLQEKARGPYYPIRSIIDGHGSEEASVKDLRIPAICSSGFAGFLRFNELSNIQPKHLTFCNGFVKIFVPGSKTDVYREGNYVYIAKLEGKYCPVTYVGILKRSIWICLVTCLYSGL